MPQPDTIQLSICLSIVNYQLFPGDGLRLAQPLRSSLVFPVSLLFFLDNHLTLKYRIFSNQYELRKWRQSANLCRWNYGTGVFKGW